MSAELTICTVFFRDKWALDLNHELTSSLNDSDSFRWVAIQNKPAHPDDTGGSGRRYELLEGAEVGDPPPNIGKPSWHHGLGLNLAADAIQTRYALFLDTDCYLVRPNWVNDVVDHMARHRLAFFGTPYHPRNHSKTRYFPCGVCFFVDTHQVSPRDLDWRAVPVGSSADSRRSLGARALWAVLRRTGLERRVAVGRSKDTGYRIYERYARAAGFPSECVQPVFRPEMLEAPSWDLKLDRYLPERLSLTPKRVGYCTEAGFETHGHPEVGEAGCEEFMWQNDPFALHLRGSLGRVKSREHAARLVRAFLPEAKNKRENG